MIRILSSASNWRFIVPLFILFAIFSFYLFPKYQTALVNAAGEDLAPLDTRFSYSVEDVNYYLGKLGREGRDIYRVVVGRIDMLYPLTYGGVFALVLAYLLRNLTRPGSKWMLLSLLPLVGMVLDYFENINILGLLNSYPNLDSQSVTTGESLTQGKHVLLLLSVALILILGIAVLVKRFVQRKTIYHTGN